MIRHVVLRYEEEKQRRRLAKTEGERKRAAKQQERQAASAVSHAGQPSSLNRLTYMISMSASAAAWHSVRLTT